MFFALGHCLAPNPYSSQVLAVILLLSIYFLSPVLAKAFLLQPALFVPTSVFCVFFSLCSRYLVLAFLVLLRHLPPSKVFPSSFPCFLLSCSRHPVLAHYLFFLHSPLVCCLNRKSIVFEHCVSSVCCFTLSPFLPAYMPGRVICCSHI